MNVFMINKLKCIVLNELPQPSKPYDGKTVEMETYEYWLDRNDQALGILWQTCNTIIAGTFSKETKACEVWAQLKRTYEKGTVAEQMIDLSEILNWKLPDNDPTTTLAKFDYHVRRLDT